MCACLHAYRFEGVAAVSCSLVVKEGSNIHITIGEPQCTLSVLLSTHKLAYDTRMAVAAAVVVVVLVEVVVVVGVGGG